MSKKLTTACQKKTRQTREHSDHGSQLYYKRNGEQNWKGLGKVVGDDGVIFIRHRGFFIKANCSRVQLAHNLENSNLNHQTENIDNSQDEESRKSTQEKINNKTRIDDSDDEPIVHNSKKSISANNSSKKLNEENTTTLEKSTNKLATVNINDNNNN